MEPKFKRILYGGDYNPNQWPEEIWKEDMRIFRNARINSATINVFSWAKIQPSEHEYRFDELDRMSRFFYVQEIRILQEEKRNRPFRIMGRYGVWYGENRAGRAVYSLFIRRTQNVHKTGLQ